MTKVSLLVLCTAVVNVLGACHNADIGEARKQADVFARKIPGFQSVACVDSDSDGDGYISCTVFRGDRDPVAIKCGSENYCVSNCAHGCHLVVTAGTTR
jgi:hypothetical protein